jgi:hypothetical protein
MGMRGEVKLSTYLQHPQRANQRGRNFAHALIRWKETEKIQRGKTVDIKQSSIAQ